MNVTIDSIHQHPGFLSNQERLLFVNTAQIFFPYTSRVPSGRIILIKVGISPPESMILLLLSSKNESDSQTRFNQLVSLIKIIALHLVQHVLPLDGAISKKEDQDHPFWEKFL